MNTMQKLLSAGGTLVALTSATVGGLVATSPAHAAGTPECTNANVTASYKARDAGMSHRYGTLILTNTSDTTCTIQGYGGLSYVGGGNGKQVGAAAIRTPSKARRVVLEPGDKARSAVQETSTAPYSAAQCDPTKVDGFRVYIPDETKSQFVEHATTGCANTSVKLLAHKTFH
jgi:hypothetical protein